MHEGNKDGWNWSRRNFLKVLTLVPAAKVTEKFFSESKSESESDPIIEKVTNFKLQIKDIWNVDVSFDTDIASNEQLNLVEKLFIYLQVFPPIFFEQCSKVRKTLLSINNAIGNDEQSSRLDDVLSFRIGEPVEGSGGHYEGNPPKIVIKAENLKANTICHEFGHYLQDILGSLPNTGNQEEIYTGNPVYGDISFDDQLTVYQKLFPQFVSSYSLSSYHEDFAENVEFSLLQQMESYFETSGGKLKNQLIRELLLWISQGLMDDVYFNDLRENRVDLSYWDTKLPAPNFFDVKDGQILYLADLDKSEEKLVGLVRHQLCKEKIIHPTIGGDSISISDSQQMLFRVHQTEPNNIELVVNGTSSLFLSLSAGDTVESAIQTEHFFHRLFFTHRHGKIEMAILETKPSAVEEVPFVSPSQAEQAFKQSENIWALLNGMTTAGISALLTELMYSIHPAKIKKNSEEVSEPPISRRAFLKGMIATGLAAGVAGVHKYGGSLVSKSMTAYVDFREKISSVIQKKENLQHQVIEASRWWEHVENEYEFFQQDITNAELPETINFELEVVSEKELKYKGVLHKTEQGYHPDAFKSEDGKKVVILPLIGDSEMYLYIQKFSFNENIVKVEISPFIDLETPDLVWTELLTRDVIMNDLAVFKGCYIKLTKNDGTTRNIAIFRVPKHADFIKNSGQNFDPGSFTSPPKNVTSDIYGIDESESLPNPTFDIE